MDEFEDLIEEAERHPTEGWDFSWLGDRLKTGELPWDYRLLADRFAGASPSLLDLGTGGGERLANLANRPLRTVATEAWSPNVEIAAMRLSPLGVAIVHVEGAPDNNRQEVGAERPFLPFSDEAFHVVCSRHESFVAMEVARVLESGGRFISQQMSDGDRGFHDLLGVTIEPSRPLTLAMMSAQLERAGLVVEESAEGSVEVQFADVGALAWYLRMVPWTRPTFALPKDRNRLACVHERINAEGPVAVDMPAFYVVAAKP